MKTCIPESEKIEKNWYVVDAKDQILGRFTSKIASILRGKSKAIYTPHLDAGDYIIVINADRIRTTGKKLSTKTYKRYSGYPGGLKEETLEHMLRRKPEEVIRHAVKGMLPKTKLGTKLLKKLKVYAGDKHPHIAQKPKLLKI